MNSRQLKSVNSNNTLDDLADSCNYILKKNGLPQHSTEEIKYMVGNGIPKLIERAMCSVTMGTEISDNTKGTEINVIDSQLHKKLLSEYIEWYGEHSAIKTAPYPGMLDLLVKLKKTGIKLAVNTNKVHSSAVDLCERYFAELFDFVAGSRDGIAPKPSPEGVNQILVNLNIKADECVFIGDSDVDIQTGKNAGIDSIGVDWGFRGAAFLKAHGGEKIAYSCDELFNLIKNSQ